MKIFCQMVFFKYISKLTKYHQVVPKKINGRQVRTFVNTRISSSKKDGSSNGDDRKDKDKEETINKLNALLKVMVEDDSSKALTTSQSLELAKPKKRFNTKAEQKQKGLGNQLKDAAKHVADTIGGNTQETEMELLGKLLGTTSTSSANLNELLSGMKVEQKSSGEISRAQQVRSALQRGSPRQTKNFEQRGNISERLRTESHIKLRKRVGMHVDIFGAEPSNYFVDIKPATDIPKMETWENCLNRELRLSVTHPPSNIYEQIMIWTERGIFWKFPIDNEQGLEDEKQVSFEDHIFLETHLEGWCPEKGPIKHFMELVIVGLSKNFWMTAEEKKQHIFWYRDYFKDKNTLLQELGAGNIGEAEGQNENAAQTTNA